MDIGSVFSGDSLKAADLQGTEPVVVIATVTMKKFDNGNKLVLTFQGKKKTLVVNKTNANRIAYAHGPNTDNWIGKEIQLYTDLVDFQGNTVQAIRVRPPPKRAAAQQNGGQREHVIEQRSGYQLSSTRRADPIEEATGAVTRDPADDEIPF